MKFAEVSKVYLILGMFDTGERCVCISRTHYCLVVVYSIDVRHHNYAV